MRAFDILDFFRIFIVWTRGPRRAMCHTFSVPFSLRNNLFRPGFNSIFLKWTFFKYLTFFKIFLKISFPSPLDACRFEFRENPTVSELNEIRLGN